MIFTDIGPDKFTWRWQAAQDGKTWAVPCLAMLALGCVSASGHDLLIEHVTVVSPERSAPLRDATVFIVDDHIRSISTTPTAQRPRISKKQTSVIDGHGFYLVPGLIDSHVHTAGTPGMGPRQEQAFPDLAREARQQVPRSYLYFGFTTLIDLISEPKAIAAWNANDVHPDIYFCGGAPIADGYPMNWDPKPQRYEEYPYMIVERGTRAPENIDPAIHTPEAAVARMKADGAICVKSFFERQGEQSLPVPRLDTVQALVQAAHAAHLPVLMHATGSEAQSFALAAGVDIIAHGLWDWNDEPRETYDLTPSIQKILDRVIETKTGWQATMQVGYGFRDLFDPDFLTNPQIQHVYPAALIAWFRSPEGQWFRNLLAPGLLPKDGLETMDAQAEWQTVKSSYEVTFARNRNTTHYLALRNARLLFGTDTPAVPTYANPPGLNGWLEMHRLVDAGLTPARVFRAATISNAKALGLDRDIGSVQVGKRANLLLLRADPTETIEAYDGLVQVILRGRVIDRAALAADRPR
jgi:imidazolonepropionase-like amidohydrolase